MRTRSEFQLEFGQDTTGFPTHPVRTPRQDQLDRVQLDQVQLGQDKARVRLGRVRLGQDKARPG